MSDDATPPTETVPPKGAELRTFLIADIRGYTKYTREHGDEVAAALAGTFASLVEAAVTAHEGTLVELRGDEALAMFVSARQALRAAVAIQAAVTAAKLPGGVGIGLDAGEAIPVDAGYRGGALNLAARLCSRARAGEIIASDSVIHLAAHVQGIAYVEPRTLHVKGFSDAVRTVNVIAETDIRRGMRPSFERVTKRVWRSDWRPALSVVAALVVTLAVIAGATGLLQSASARQTPGNSDFAARSGPPAEPSARATSVSTASPAPTPDLLATANLPLVAFIDPSSGEVIDTLALAKPGDMSTFFDGSFWILGFNPRALYRIDPTTHEITQTIEIPVENDGGFAFADRTIWVGDNDSPRVVGIDARTGAKIHDFQLKAPGDYDHGINSLAVGAGSIWAARGIDADILRADEKTGQLQTGIPIGVGVAGPDVVAFNGGALWVTQGGKLTRIDPVTNEATIAPVLAANQFLPFISWDGAAAWTSNPDQGLVFQVDRDGRARTFQTGRGAGPLAFEKGLVWVANRESGSISAIDATTGEVRTVTLGHVPGSMAAGGGQLMVAIGATPSEQVAALPDPTLIVAMAGDPLYFRPDPAVNSIWDFRTLQLATCASLMAYPDKSGTEGLELVPEVAAAVPAVSADGLTYTFKIRPGFTFSPPSNEPITAETFRFSIERALSGRFGDNPNIALLDHIVGAHEFNEGTADSVAGLSAAGDTLTIRLSDPDPVLPKKLTWPTLCPVPLGTPAVEGGVEPDPPLSSAGPYYISKVFGDLGIDGVGGLVVLTKNPNYPGSRPQTYESIAVLTGLDPGDAIARVNQGEADVALSTDRLFGLGTEIDTQWGPGSPAAAAGEQRFFLGPVPGVEYLALNAQSGIFRDPDVRRAAWLAIDRAGIAAVFAEPAADSLLAPTSAYSGDPPDPIPAPQLAEARTLMNGRQATVTFAVRRGWLENTTIANTVKSNLAQIGITVKIQEEDDVIAAASDRPSSIDMVYSYEQTGVVDPAGLLDLIVSEGVPDGWLPPDVSARVSEITSETGAKRDADAIEIAKRLDTDELYLLPFGASESPAYVSPRVGCALIQPGWYRLDLVALCPR